MAALIRGLRAGRALRGLSSVAVQGALSPQCSNVRRGFHRAALLRLTSDSKSDTSVPPPSYHEVHTARESSSSSAQGESSEDAQPNSSFQDQSGEHGEDYETEEQLQARILTTALEFVPQHGWTVEAIAAGAETLGLSSASTGMFNNGAGDLVLHFIAQCNAQLAETLAEQNNQVQLGQAEFGDHPLPLNDYQTATVKVKNLRLCSAEETKSPTSWMPWGSKKTAEFLKDAVETRLRMLVPYIDTWPQAMSILLLPHNIPDSLKHLSTMVDDIWYYAGDRSTDVNWYTRRAALTGIYNTTELVMVQDSSPDFEETWAFLDNRIKDVVNIANTAKQVQATGEAVVQGLMGAAITLKNLTGMNQRR